MIQFRSGVAADLVVQLVLQLPALFFDFSELCCEANLLLCELSVAFIDCFQPLSVLHFLTLNLFLLLNGDFFLSCELFSQFINLGLGSDAVHFMLVIELFVIFLQLCVLSFKFLIISCLLLEPIVSFIELYC